MNNINEKERPLLESESDFLNKWLRDIEYKNKTITGRLMSLHDWEAGLKRAEKRFKSENK